MVAVFFFISGFGFSTWASRIPVIQQQLHLNEAQLGAVLFALPVGLLVTLPITGILLTRYDSRLIMVIGATLFNIMLCGIGFANQSWELVIALFFFGCGRNLFNISANAQSIGVQKLYGRSIIASFHAIWSLAMFGGAALGSVMISFSVSTGWHFLIVGSFMTLVVFAAAPGCLPQAPAATERKPGLVLPDRTLVKYGLISFASMACEGTMIDWSGIYFHKAVHVSRQMASLAFVAYMIAITLGRFTGDRLVNRYGIRKTLAYSGVLICLGLTLAVLFPYPIPAGLGFVCTGFGVSCVIPMVFSMAGTKSSMSSGPAIAAVSTVGYLGFLVVPPLVGTVAQYAGLPWSFALMALFGASITILVQFTLEKPAKQNSSPLGKRIWPGSWRGQRNG
jgi:MFS family permease